MKHSMVGSFASIRLSPLTRDVSQHMRKVRNMQRSCFIDSSLIDEKAQDAWYSRYLEIPGDYMFEIHFEDRAVGQVGLYNVDESASQCEFGRLLVDPAFAGNHIGLYATIAASDIAFNKMKLAAVHLEVFEDNAPAIATYEKAGFVYTGEQISDDGRRVLGMVITADTFSSSEIAGCAN